MLKTPGCGLQRPWGWDAGPGARRQGQSLAGLGLVFSVYPGHPPPQALGAGSLSTSGLGGCCQVAWILGGFPWFASMCWCPGSPRLSLPLCLFTGGLVWGEQALIPYLFCFHCTTSSHNVANRRTPEHRCVLNFVQTRQLYASRKDICLIYSISSRYPS